MRRTDSAVNMERSWATQLMQLSYGAMHHMGLRNTTFRALIVLLFTSLTFQIDLPHLDWI